MEPFAPPPVPAGPAPRSLGQILDAGFDVVRRHWVVLVGLAALVYVPVSFVEEVLPEDPSQPFAGGAAWLLGLLAFVIVALPVVIAAVTDACGDYHHGRETDAGRALRRGLGLALPLSWTYLVLALVAFVVLLPLFAVIAVWEPLGFAAVPVALLAVALPFVVMLRFSLLTQVAVLEGRSGPGALVRASRLVEGQVLRVFGVYVVVGLLMGLLGGAAGLALGTLAGLAPVAIGLVQAAGFAYTTAVGVVLYEDVRARKGEHERFAAPGS